MSDRQDTGIGQSTDDTEHVEQDGSIRWMSDGPVIKLANGNEVRLRVQNLDYEDWMALSVDPIDKFATFGPEVNDDRVAIWFEEDSPSSTEKDR